MIELTDTEREFVARLWQMLGDRDPSAHTGIVALEGSNVQVGLSGREENLTALGKLAASLAANGASNAAVESLDRAIAELREPGREGVLRVLWMGVQAPRVLDTVAPTVFDRERA